MIDRIGQLFDHRCAPCKKPFPHEVTLVDEPFYLLCCPDCRAVNAYTFDKDPKATPSYRLKATVQEHAALMDHRGERTLLPYATSGTFTDGQYLVHPKFGEGYILSVFGPPPKIEVLFADGKHVLVCGAGSASNKSHAAALAFQERARTREARAKRSNAYQAARPARAARDLGGPKS